MLPEDPCLPIEPAAPKAPSPVDRSQRVDMTFQGPVTNAVGISNTGEK